MIAFVGTLPRGALKGIVEALEARVRTERELAEALEREQVAQFEIERLRLRLDVVERLARAYQESDSAQRQKLRELAPERAS